MRIAELSRRSEVPVPTIKYYLRTGLLPAGDRTGPNQADYGPAHLRRLRLIRAFLEVGKLSISAIGELLAVIDEHRDDVHEAIGTALAATHTDTANVEADSPHRRAAREHADALLAERGWTEYCQPAEYDALVNTLAAYYRLGATDLLDGLGRYADAASAMADVEVAAVLARTDVDSVVEGALVGTILGESALATLRRIAHVEASARRKDTARARVRQTRPS